MMRKGYRPKANSRHSGVLLHVLGALGVPCHTLAFAQISTSNIEFRQITQILQNTIHPFIV